MARTEGEAAEALAGTVADPTLARRPEKLAAWAGAGAILCLPKAAPLTQKLEAWALA